MVTDIDIYNNCSFLPFVYVYHRTADLDQKRERGERERERGGGEKDHKAM